MAADSARFQGVTYQDGRMQLLIFPEGSALVQRVRLTAADERVLVDTILERWRSKAYPNGQEAASKRLYEDKTFYED